MVNLEYLLKCAEHSNFINEKRYHKLIEEYGGPGFIDDLIMTTPAGENNLIAFQNTVEAVRLCLRDDALPDPVKVKIFNYLSDTMLDIGDSRKHGVWQHVYQYIDLSEWDQKYAHQRDIIAITRLARFPLIVGRWLMYSPNYTNVQKLLSRKKYREALSDEVCSLISQIDNSDPNQWFWTQKYDVGILAGLSLLNQPPKPDNAREWFDLFVSSRKAFMNKGQFSENNWDYLIHMSVPIMQEYAGHSPPVEITSRLLELLITIKNNPDPEVQSWYNARGRNTFRKLWQLAHDAYVEATRQDNDSISAPAELTRFGVDLAGMAAEIGQRDEWIDCVQRTKKYIRRNFPNTTQSSAYENALKGVLAHFTDLGIRAAIFYQEIRYHGLARMSNGLPAYDLITQLEAVGP